LHLHRLQTDYWHVVDGAITAALVDVRPGSATRGTALCVSLEAARPQALVIPPGVLHGFHAESSVVLMYLLDQEYDASDEYGVRWNDRALGLPAKWYEVASPVVSPRDAGARGLAELRMEGIA
jgi:dTDP-4-dehydrorhamnose 3,5-epimerase